MKKVLNFLIVISLLIGFASLAGCKDKADIPTLTTNAATDITISTATTGGKITSDGGAEITAKGVCWGTTTAPAITGSKTSDGTGSASFTSSLTGLTPNTTYYVRAYATNEAGTGYGTEITFKTGQIVVATVTTSTISAITATSVTAGGEVTANGGGTLTARGVCWGLTANPTTADSKLLDAANTTGKFTSSVTGLTGGTTYHIRAFATNEAGTAYGADVTFTTSAIGATVTTTDASEITASSITTGGNVTSDGGSAVTEKGICWATTTAPEATGSHIPAAAGGTGAFTSTITGLSPNTKYYIRAYATNATGTSYGAEIQATTLASIPTVTTAATITGINQTVATSGGNVTSEGGATVTAKGVCWGTSADPTVEGSHVSSGTGTGAFTSSLTGLTPGTLYHVRAYATNSVGTAYGTDVTFTTSPYALATVTTTSVSTIASTTAVSGGNISANGGGTISAKGICWGTSVNPTISNSHTTETVGAGTGSFTSNLTGLTSGTTYYVRAYATNQAGTAYGTQVTFNTLLADNDGNTYHVVAIGTQMWMAENLKTTKYSNDNSNIPNVTVNADWAALTTPAYCWFNNDETTNKPLFGAMYNWYVVNTGYLCPTGWHVPTDEEFKTLEMHLGMSQTDADALNMRGTDQGTQLKSTTGWTTGNGTNTTGFTALPGGVRYYGDGTFNYEGEMSYWWSSTAASSTSGYYRRLDGSAAGVYRGGATNAAGKYVRCVKD